MQDNGVRTQTIRLAEATPHPENYNEHDTVQLARLRGSLAAFGYVRRIVVQEHADGSGYTLVAGHGVAEALEASGYEEVEATVLPSDWSYEKVMAYLVADNELAKLAQSDNEQLARLLQHLEENAPELVEATGFDDERLNELLESIGFGAGNGSQGDAEPQIDRAEELRQVWRTELGQLWQIGEHRLICGDCTDRAVVERVMGGERADTMITDPPYAIYGSSTGIGGDITDNNMVKPFIREVLRIAEQNVKLRGHTYIFCDWRSYATWWDVLNSPNHKVCNCIVWDKGDGGLGAMYTMRHEFIVFGEIIPKAITMTERAKGKHRAVNGLANVMRFNVPQNSERLHNAAKPVDLLRVFVGASSDQGQLVIEPFAGSGTTLVACQNLSRRCRAVEISPAYCAVILQRMSDAFPGIDIRML